MSRVLVTTDYLVPGDEVAALLRRHDHEVVYRPAAGPRLPGEARALFDGVHGATIASEPVTADVIAGATELRVISRSGFIAVLDGCDHAIPSTDPEPAPKGPS